ncbi:DUF6290 family protein (plasmid) [Carnobacterium maltaromaticum]|uniref:DUF6290 family protein n=1 Tax=Carnobacterium maltaromaticum TaxID=2751 RepID=UPI00344F525F
MSIQEKNSTKILKNKKVKTEDRIDIEAYEKAMQSHKEKSKTISFDEMMKELEKQSKSLDKKH